METTTKATVRNQGACIFRILFGLFILGLGIHRYWQYGGPSDVALFTIGIGVISIAYGAYGFLLGNKVEVVTPTSTGTSTERLAEIVKMKDTGLISQQEFESKRQEILKDL